MIKDWEGCGWWTGRGGGVDEGQKDRKTKSHNILKERKTEILMEAKGQLNVEIVCE